MKRKHFLQSFIPAAIGSMLLKQGIAMPETVTDGLQIKMPPYLKPGDTIGITCPAGPMKSSDLQLCKEGVKKWGLNVKYGSTVNKHWQRFGGTDEERAADLQKMLDDENINAIMFGRGGYGVMRMMDKLNWNQFARQPKWLIGFSDITAFHCHVQAVYGIPTIHADMGNGFNGTEDAAVTTLKSMLFGKKQQYTSPYFSLNRTGNATGKLVGGNLSLLVAMQGSKSAIKTDGKILFIEDVSEYKYTIDRMMMNLKRSGMFDNLAGIVFGAFTATKQNEDPYPMSMEEIIFEKVKEYHYPVCFHFPAGHQKENMALKLGTYYKLEVTQSGCLLAETNDVPKRLIEMPMIDSIPSNVDTARVITDSIRIIK